MLNVTKEPHHRKKIINNHQRKIIENEISHFNTQQL